MDTEAQVVSSVSRALKLLEALTNGPLGVTDLAHRIGSSKATAFRLARTLQVAGYVVQLDDSRYRLGPRCLMLAASSFGNIDLRRDLRWAEEELNERTQETTLLTVVAGREAVCIDSIPSQRSVVSVATVGAVWPLHASAPGLAALAADAALLDKYLSEPLSRHTDKTITDPHELRRVLEQVRDCGYAVNDEYWREDVCAVGAVVNDATGGLVAALSVVLPTFRLQETGVELLGALVVDVALRASQRLGWRPATALAPG